MAEWTNQQFQAWLDSVGGDGNVQKVEKKVTRKPTASELEKGKWIDGTEIDPKNQSRDEVETTFVVKSGPKKGASVTMTRIPGSDGKTDADLAKPPDNFVDKDAGGEHDPNSYNVTTKDAPAQTAAQANANNPAPAVSTEAPFLPIRKADGSYEFKPNPNYKGPPPPKPKSITGGGTNDKQIGFVSEDGTTQWFDNPNYNKPKSEIVEIDGQKAEVVRGDDGVIVSVKPLSVAPDKGPDVSGAPAAAFTPLHVVEDLRKYAEWLDGERAAGRITVAQQQKLWDTRKGLADSYIAEQKAGQEQTNKLRDQDLTQRNQDITDDNNRVTEAGKNLKTSLDSATEVNKYLQPGSKLGGKLLLGNLVMGQTMAKAYGGLGERPTGAAPAGVPASAMAHIGNPAVATAPAAVAAAAPQPSGPPDPNAAQIPASVATNGGVMPSDQVQQIGGLGATAPPVGGMQPGGSPVHITFNVSGQGLTPGASGPPTMTDPVTPAIPARPPVTPADFQPVDAPAAVAGMGGQSDAMGQPIAPPSPAMDAGAPQPDLPATTASADPATPLSGEAASLNVPSFGMQDVNRWIMEAMPDFDPESLKAGSASFLGAG